MCQGMLVLHLRRFFRQVQLDSAFTRELESNLAMLGCHKEPCKLTPTYITDYFSHAEKQLFCIIL